MSVRPKDIFTTIGIKKIPPTPGSKTQARKARKDAHKAGAVKHY